MSAAIEAQNVGDVDTDQGEPLQPVRGFNYRVGGDYQGDTPDKAKIVKAFQTIKEDWDRYRMKFVAEWLKCYNQYNGIVDDQNKSEWQARISIPEAKRAVDTSAARIMSSILDNEDFFDIQPYIKLDDQRVDTAKKLIKWQLWKSNYRDSWPVSIKDALICGFGPMKVRPQRDAKDRFRIVYEPEMPTNVWIDPTGRGRGIIHRTKRSISDLEAAARNGVYDMEEVKKVKPGSTDSEREVQGSIIRRDTPHLASDLGIDVYEYWGDFYDPATGAVLYENCLITFAYDQFMIRAPEQNPYTNIESPFVIFTASVVPHQLYGMGVLLPGNMILDEINKAWCVILDKQRFQVPQTICYPGALRNPEEMQSSKPKFVPGKVWMGKDPSRPPFTPMLGFNPPNQDDFQIIDRLTLAYQQSVGVSEFATGASETTNRKTKEEVQARTAAASQVFNDAASHIEDTAISPMLKMLYELMVQFENEYDDDNLQRMFGDQDDGGAAIAQLKNMPPDVRWKVMALDAEFRCNAISRSATLNDRLNRLMGFMQIVNGDPSLAALVDKRWELRDLIQNFKQDTRMVLAQSDAILQAQEQQRLAMLMAPMQQQAGGQTEQGNPHNQQAAGAAQGKRAAQQAGGPQGPQPPQQGPPRPQ